MLIIQYNTVKTQQNLLAFCGTSIPSAEQYASFFGSQHPSVKPPKAKRVPPTSGPLGTDARGTSDIGMDGDEPESVLDKLFSVPTEPVGKLPGVTVSAAKATAVAGALASL